MRIFFKGILNLGFSEGFYGRFFGAITKGISGKSMETFLRKLMGGFVKESLETSQQEEIIEGISEEKFLKYMQQFWK